jgi:hypothetical protein
MLTWKGATGRVARVAGYRSDFQLGSNFAETAKTYLFNPEFNNAWVNRAFNELVSRTDVFVAPRAVVVVTTQISHATSSTRILNRRCIS